MPHRHSANVVNPVYARGNGRITALRAGFAHTCAQNPGFTLIELMVALSILAVAIGVIGACVAAGLRVWDRVRDTTSLTSSVFTGIEILERDLRNTAGFDGIPFSGEMERVVIASLTRPASGSVDGPRLTTVRYRYDRPRGMLLRKAWIFPDPEPPDETEEGILEHLSRVEFSYAGAPAQAREFSLTATNIPLQVRVNLEFERPAVRLERVVLIPVGAK
jgi:prepilin-type N-terminal cleavage/methylation domain-containing protein